MTWSSSDINIKNNNCFGSYLQLINIEYVMHIYGKKKLKQINDSHINLSHIIWKLQEFIKSKPHPFILNAICLLFYDTMDISKNNDNDIYIMYIYDIQ